MGKTRRGFTELVLVAANGPGPTEPISEARRTLFTPTSIMSIVMTDSSLLDKSTRL